METPWHYHSYVHIPQTLHLLLVCCIYNNISPIGPKELNDLRTNCPPVMKLLSVLTAAPVLMAWEGHYLQPGPGKAVQDCKVLYVSLRPQLHMMHTIIVSLYTHMEVHDHSVTIYSHGCTQIYGVTIIYPHGCTYICFMLPLRPKLPSQITQPQQTSRWPKLTRVALINVN